MFVELKCKTNFSFLEGASHPQDLIRQAAELRMPALALTDRNGVYGIPKAWQALKNGELPIKLISGAEITFEDASTTSTASLTFLAQNRAAYGLLCRLLTAAHEGKEKGTAALDWPRLLSLLDHPGKSGLIVLANAPDYPSIKKSPSPPSATNAHVYQLGPLREIFGKNTFLTLSRHLDGHDKSRTESTLLAEKLFGIPIVATNDVLYHLKEKKPLQDLLTCIRNIDRLEGAGYKLQSNSERYLKSEEQMLQLFRDRPDAVHLTGEIAESCIFRLNELKYRYPSEWIPQGETAHSFLGHLTWKGARWRYGDDIPSDVEKQIRAELKIINELTFADYFLTIWDIVEYAKQKKILCQGRGSAANSVVCYCLGITAIDPIRMNLLFERFISVERAEPPDIDVDFEHERREEVIQYIYAKYGRDRAAMVSAVSTYRTKGALRDIPKALGDDPIALGHLERFTEEIQDFPRHLSIHSGGFTLSADPIIETVPVENARMEGRTIVQWDKYDLDTVGLVKVDVLALGMLTAIQKTFDLVNRFEVEQKIETAKHGSPGGTYPPGELTLATLPAEDKATYDMICKADTIGVFQIESRAQMNMLGRLHPRTFYDLVVEVAIVRPGPISGDMVHPYLKRRRGLEKIEYPHPKLEPILGKTLGVPLFQEQVMKMAIDLAGFTPGEADQLRRAIGAWRSDGSIEKMGQRLMRGLQAAGLTQEFVDRIFKQIKGFAEYGFPESHAASFALLAYASSWLKCHKPAEFLCGLLNSQPMGFYSSHTLVEDAKHHGVMVLPVHPNFSQWDSTLITDKSIPQGKAVRLGFHRARGLSQAEYARLDETRKEKQFSDLYDFIRRARPPSDVLQNLAMGDSFRAFGLNQREALWGILEHDMLLRSRNSLQPSLFSQINPEETLRFEEMPAFEQIREDYNVFGLSTKNHPMMILRGELKVNLLTAVKAKTFPKNSLVRVGGLVIARQRPQTAKGLVFATIEDETGFMDTVIKPDVFEKYKDLMSRQSFVIAEGILQKDGDSYSLLVKKLENLWMQRKEAPRAEFPKVPDKAWG